METSVREKLGRPTTRINERAHMFAAAGILHDIGKISKPAGVKITEKERRLENQACPTWDGRYTHDHVLHTAWILHQAKPPLGGLNIDEVFRIAVNHHRPSTNDPDEIIIAQADRLASAHDRRDKPSGEDDWPTGLDALLCSVRGGKPTTNKTQIPTGLLSFEEKNYLPCGPQTKEEYENACKNLTNALISALANPTNENNNAFATCERLLAIAQRTMHAIPASRWKKTKPDVTLLDHSRIVASFAACLGAQFDSGSEVTDGKYRLVSFRVSGIQNFIFRDIQSPDSPTSHKGMAKRLRATSTLIALLTTLAGRRMLQWTGMPITNMVLDAGGNGMLLMPATKEIDILLDEAINWLHEWMHLNLLGGCRLLVDKSPILSDEDFKAGKCANSFRNAQDRVNTTAMHPPTSNFFGDSGWDENVFVTSGEGGFKIDRSNFKKKLSDFGGALPKSNYVQLDNPEAKINIDIFGYKVGLHKNKPTLGHYWSLALDESLDIPTQLITSHLPTDENGDTLDFNNLSSRSVDAYGKPISHSMLGAIKADVDRLGLIMGYGLGKDSVSFGRLATLSRSLDYFFKGFLSEKLKTEFPNIYTVFGGGDDLFLVGPWYDIVRVAPKLHDWFTELTSGNPEVTISAGVIFTHPSQPIRSIGESAEEALGHAKNSGRNRITIAGETISWNMFSKVLSLQKALLEAASETSKLYRVLQYAQMGLRAENTGNLSDLKWRSQMTYDMKRNWDPDNPAMNEIHQAINPLHTRVSPTILKIAATLALYLIRGGNNE